MDMLELQEDLFWEGFAFVSSSLFGSRTQIRSPDTMSQEDKVCPATESSSEPFRDKLKALSDLRPGREALEHSCRGTETVTQYL